MNYFQRKIYVSRGRIFALVILSLVIGYFIGGPESVVTCSGGVCF